MDGIADRVARARKAAGLTQHDLATRTGIRSNTICRYEKGHLSPSVDALTKLADGLDVTIAWLATGEGEGPPAPVVALPSVPREHNESLPRHRSAGEVSR